MRFQAGKVFEGSAESKDCLAETGFLRAGHSVFSTGVRLVILRSFWFVEGGFWSCVSSSGAWVLLFFWSAIVIFFLDSRKPHLLESVLSRSRFWRSCPMDTILSSF
ncbi:hypothetical protein NC652_008278 [Populus alba x Populus x berolinensis]|nr:hypothetical protein NC652_008278 [Populus alba x Populus x berolinensis]